MFVVREAGQSLIGDVGSQVEVKDPSANIIIFSLVIDTGIHLAICLYLGRVNSHLVKLEGFSAPTLGRRAQIGEMRKTVCANTLDWESQFSCSSFIACVT